MTLLDVLNQHPILALLALWGVWDVAVRLATLVAGRRGEKPAEADGVVDDE